MWSVYIHGGAGNIPKTTPVDATNTILVHARDRAVAVVTGQSPGILRSTSPTASVALAAAVEAVLVLEDSPLFNAGRGSCLNADGKCELEAAVIEGQTLSTGACCGLTTVRNPVLLAEHVRVNTPHTMIGFHAAEKLAEEAGLKRQDPEWFIISKRERQRLRALETGEIALDHDIHLPTGDTVGAVVLDMDGHLAGAVSTGGKTNKYVGRIGDSPCIGAGLYASPLAAVCGTGEGEYFVENNVCAQVCHAMKYGKLSLQTAVDRVMADLPEGSGGVIAVDATGEIALSFNSTGMHRAYATSRGESYVGAWEEPIRS